MPPQSRLLAEVRHEGKSSPARGYPSGGSVGRILQFVLAEIPLLRTISRNQPAQSEEHRNANSSARCLFSPRKQATCVLATIGTMNKIGCSQQTVKPTALPKVGGSNPPPRNQFQPMSRNGHHRPFNQLSGFDPSSRRRATRSQTDSSAKVRLISCSATAKCQPVANAGKR